MGIEPIFNGKTGSEEKAKSFTGKEKIWLGGLDSNQDSQIQSLESYQLDDLPVEIRALKLQHGLHRWVKWVNLNEISNTIKLILDELGTKMRVAFHHPVAPRDGI